MADYDNDGNKYSPGFLSLLSVRSGTTKITIPSTVESVYGVDKNDYAFILCKSTLQKAEFASGSNLKIIKPYSFFECASLQSIDLSVCAQLTGISEYAFSGNITRFFKINWRAKF